MIYSKQSLLSDAQAVTATAASTNVYDLGANGTPVGASAALNRDMGKGLQVKLDVRVVTTFATLTSLTVTLEQDDDVAFGTVTTVGGTQAIPVASLVAGYKFNLDRLLLGLTKRYFRLKYTVAGSNATAGAITAGVVLDGTQTAPL